MSPTPLDLSLGPGPARIGVSQLPRHEFVSSVVFDVVSAWSQIDLALGNFVCDLGEKSALLTVGEALDKSLDGKMKWLQAESKNVLGHVDGALVEAVIEVVGRSKKDRNRLAHHVWGLILGRSDIWLLSDPKSAVRFRRAMMRPFASVEEWRSRSNRIKIDQWTEEDLEGSRSRAQAALVTVDGLIRACVGVPKEKFWHKTLEVPGVRAVFEDRMLTYGFQFE